MKWWELVLQVPSGDADRVAARIAEHAYGGIAVEPAIVTEAGTEEFALETGSPSVVRAYLPIDADFPAKRERLLEQVLTLPAAAHAVEREIEESDWAHAWQRHIKPVRIGARLVVRPPWSRARAPAGAAVVVLEPGMAFGTGDHPTTRACLKALVRFVRPWQRVLDLGTGSGILAIAAAKLGAASVLALDTDVLAVEAARENALRNEVYRQVTVIQGSVEAAEVRGWDPALLLANLTSQLHRDLAGDIAAVMPQGCVLFGAGIGEAGLPGVMDAYRSAGARRIRVGRTGAWRTVMWTKA